MNHPEPEVLIGIPTLNGPDRLERCLHAIRLHTPWAGPEGLEKIKVLVVDDCSTSDNLQRNKEVIHKFGIEMLMHEVRRGVAAGWNDLTRHTQAPYVILMNDDVEVVPDWYDALVYSLKHNPEAGMIGLPAYQGVNSLNFTPPPRQSYNEAKMQHGVGMISSTGFLFGFERKKYDAVGGFDEGFFLFYEEVDFGVRLLLKRWLSYMLSYPTVIHQGGASTSDSRNVPDAKAILDESRIRFKQKHGCIAFVRQLMAEVSKVREGPLGLLRGADPVEWNTMLKTWVD